MLGMLVGMLKIMSMTIRSPLFEGFCKTLGMLGMLPPYLHTRARLRTRPQDRKTTYSNSVAP